MSERQAQKARSRERLIRALLFTLQHDGFHALTTGRVAKRAGLAQPTFYFHFRDMDEALEELATPLARELDDACRDDGASPSEPASVALRRTLSRCAHALLEDQWVARVFLRCAHDDTNPLGRAWLEALDRLRQRACALVFRIRPSIAPTRASLHAEMAVGLLMAVVEATSRGHVDDLDEAVLTMCETLLASIRTDQRSAAAA